MDSNIHLYNMVGSKGKSIMIKLKGQSKVRHMQFNYKCNNSEDMKHKNNLG